MSAFANVRTVAGHVTVSRQLLDEHAEHQAAEDRYMWIAFTLLAGDPVSVGDRVWYDAANARMAAARAEYGDDWDEDW